MSHYVSTLEPAQKLKFPTCYTIKLENAIRQVTLGALVADLFEDLIKRRSIHLEKPLGSSRSVADLRNINDYDSAGLERFGKS